MPNPVVWPWNDVRRIVPVRVRTPSKQTLVQSASVDGSSTVAYSNKVNQGNLLVLAARCPGGSDISSVSDTINGAWTFAGKIEQTTDLFDVNIWYRANTGSGTPTVTASPAGRVIIAEFSGFGPNAKPFSVASAQADSGNANSGNAKVIEGGYAIGTIGYANGTDTADWSYVSGVKLLLAYRSLTGIGTSALTGNTADLWAAVEVIFDTDQVRTMPMPLRKPETRPARIVPRKIPSPCLVVQAKYASTNSGASTLTATFDQKVTPGNLIVGFLWARFPSARYPVAFTTPYDTGVLLGTPTVSDTLWIGVIQKAIGGHADVTVDLSGYNQYIRMWVAEISGQDPADAVDSYMMFNAQVYGTGTDAASQNINTKTDGALILGLAWDGNSTTVPTLGTGYTSVLTSSEGAGDAGRMEYRIAAAAGIYPVRWTITSGNEVDISAVAIRPKQVLPPLPTRTPSGVNWTKHHG